jgi:hypothetical protein
LCWRFAARPRAWILLERHMRQKTEQAANNADNQPGSA